MNHRLSLLLATSITVACLSCACSRQAEALPSDNSTPASTASSVPTSPTPVTLTDTESWELVANGSGRTYPVWVSLPASYAEDTARDYPVVFVTDALYAFPLVRSIRNLLGQKGRNIEDFILVGLPPQKGLSSLQSRSRDYTPSDPRSRADMDDGYRAEAYGEAATYRDFIEHQVFPLIADHYRSDMRRKVFAGHSYGGLFGSFVLFTKPGMFQKYVLSSPSLWFDDYSVMDAEQAYAQVNKDLPADVMVYIGSFETIKAEPRYFKNVDMLGDVRQLERTLKSRGYPRLRMNSQVVPDEDHLTVYPDAISRGLLWALPGHGPYTSG